MAIDLEGIAAALAARFASGAVTPPAGLANIRSSSANPPGAIGPTPAVVVSLNETEFDHAGRANSRMTAQSWFVRLYFDQTSDLERTEPALRKWAGVLAYQLQSSAQLGGTLVDVCHIDSIRVGVLAYGGLDYAGLELQVSTAKSEAWAATP